MQRFNLLLQSFRSLLTCYRSTRIVPTPQSLRGQFTASSGTSSTLNVAGQLNKSLQQSSRDFASWNRMPGGKKVWKKKGKAPVNDLTAPLSALSTSEASTSRIHEPALEQGSETAMSCSEAQPPEATEVQDTEKRLNDHDCESLHQSTKKTKKVTVASILSTFYPKFENESADNVVRKRMEAAVAEGKGVLEVSVKHSGSLFMWAGAQRGAFAKNSYGNEYSAVGVWVLGETLKRAWGLEEGLQKQKELGDYLQAHRLSLAMELVTSVLGDHGQRPLQDYAVVTAVVVLRSEPRFFSTADVLRLCRRWRLTSNQYWLFQSRDSVAQFMAAYQALSEEGTTQTVEDTLAGIADVIIPGSASHGELQGPIMEGLVARVVHRDSVRQLAGVLEEVPAGQDDVGSAGAGVRLREIYSRVTEPQGRIRRLVEEAGAAMCSAPDWAAVDDGEEGGSMEYHEGESNALLSQFLECSAADNTTTKLQELVRAVKQRRMPVRFKCKARISHGEEAELRADRGAVEVVQPAPDDTRGGMLAEVHHRFVITVHAYADSAFRRYNKMREEDPDLWPLYRGFFIEVYILKADQSVVAKLAAGTTSTNGCKAGAIGKPMEASGETDGSIAQEMLRSDSSTVDEPEHLMLKMKFLPYKLRTFLIRNALSTLQKEGSAKYLQQCTRQLELWGTSRSKTKEMMALCKAWSDHANLAAKGKSVLSQHSYLDAVEPFLAAYAWRSPACARAVGAPTTSAGAPDAEDEEEAPWETSSSGRGSSSSATAAAYDGLLIFFPGIPGCAKSALCEGLMKGGGLGDGRKLDHLMGDLTPGRYWKILADRRKKNRKVVSLADKNAPNRDVWDQVEQMCSSTKALGIPVVPASQGQVNNPFDWEMLSVLMWRVLQRKNHPGKLDSDLATAGYVILMFFHLYDGMERAEFEEELRSRFGTLVQIPVLRAQRGAMPDEVLGVLQDGNRLYQRLQRLTSSNNRRKKMEPQESPMREEWLAWEHRLRATLALHEDHIRSIQVPFEEVLESVREQLGAIACGRTPVERGGRADASRNAFSHAVQLAALHLPWEPLWAALQKVALADPAVQKFINGREDAVRSRLSTSHVTLGHKRSHGAAAVAKYAGVVGAPAAVRVTALLHGKTSAALEVEISQEATQRGVVSLNPFPHITIWTAQGVSAAEANNLPEEVEAGTGERIPFAQPWTCEGTVQFD